MNRIYALSVRFSSAFSSVMAQSDRGTITGTISDAAARLSLMPLSPRQTRQPAFSPALTVRPPVTHTTCIVTCRIY